MSNNVDDDLLASHKARFQGATRQYFTLLSSIDVRLRRQVYALEEASILPGELSTSRTGDTDGTGNTINALDVSWLNSRKDTVGKDKEAELWAAARKFGERITQDKVDNVSGEKMDVD